VQFDEDGTGDLDVDEVERFLSAHLNLDIGRPELMKKFEELDTDNSGQLDRKEFLPFLISLYNRNEIANIFNRYSTNAQIFPKSFRQFLSDQGEEIGETQAQKLICTLNRNSGVIASQTLAFREFQDFMFGMANWALDPMHLEICEDMTKPLTDYFIATSYNTYLCGHQLFGTSSVDMYKEALLRGCRCVEIDCWDGRQDSKGYYHPMIYNGHSLTSQISFRDVIVCIKENAFVKSPYPVIICLEMHCSTRYQLAIADILTEVLVGMLTSHDEMPNPDEPLPSPEQLRGKFLIKGDIAVSTTTKAEKEEKDPGKAKHLKELKRQQDEKQARHKSEWEKNCLNEEGSSNAFTELSLSFKNDVPVEADAKPVSAIAGSQVHRDLTDLYYIREKDIGDDDKVIAQAKEGDYGDSNGLTVFGESDLERVARHDGPGVVEYTRLRLARTDPSGLRTDSSNDNPMLAWGVGCQMVALNFQTLSGPMQCQDALFSKNGGCGYVIKPGFMRSNAPEIPLTYHPHTYAPNNYSLVVRVISGMNMPKENGDKQGEVIDPSVVIDLYCSTGTVQTKQTQAIRKNGYNPIWDEMFEFKIKNLELSLLCLTVYDIDFVTPDYIAHAGLCVKNIRQGYRFVPLVDARGALIPNSGLLCHFELRHAHRPAAPAPR